MKNTKYFNIKRIIKRDLARRTGTWPHMIKDEEVDPMVLEIMKIYDKKTDSKKNN